LASYVQPFEAVSAKVSITVPDEQAPFALKAPAVFQPVRMFVAHA
jgi:hypothetical protein